MQPAVPDPFREQEPGEDQVGYDVGEFEQGSPFSRWALARYIVGRVILDRLSFALIVVIGVLLVLAALTYFGLHSTLLTVLLVLLALIVLAMRALLVFVLRRLMGAAAYGPLEERVRKITGDASDGVLAEMGRVGLPSHVITLPLLVLKLVVSRRETMARVRRFEVERAVPKARRDELYLALRESMGRG